MSENKTTDVRLRLSPSPSSVRLSPSPSSLAFRLFRRPWFWGLAAVVALALSFIGCEGDYARPSEFENLKDLNRPDCRIGVFLGYSEEDFAKRFFPTAQILGFEDIGSAATALLAGKLEAFVSDEHVLNVALRTYPHRLKLMDDALEESPVVAAIAAKNTNLIARVNAFIAKYKKDGTYENMFLRWCQCDRYVPIPTIDPAPDAQGVLKIGTGGLTEPSTFIDENGDLTGFDIEFGLRLAKFLKMTPQFVLKPSTDFVSELRTGAVDIVLDDYDDAVPRKGIAYSDGYLDSDMRVLVAEDDPDLRATAAEEMLGQTKVGATDVLIKDPRLRLFVNGFLITVCLTLLSALFGFGLARGVARLMRRMPRWGFNATDRFFTVIRAVPPVLIVLMINGAVLPFAMPWLTLVVALALWYASFLVRTADGPAAIWLPIVRLRLPLLLQWTCVAGVVNVFDLSMAADLVCGRAFIAIGPFVAVGLAYALLAWLFDKALAVLESRVQA